MSNEPKKPKQFGLKPYLKPHLKIVLTNRLDEPLTQLEVDKLSERFYRHHKKTLYIQAQGWGYRLYKRLLTPITAE